MADEGGNLTDFSSMKGIPLGGQVVRGITGGGFPSATTSGTGAVHARAGNRSFFVALFPAGRWFAMSNPDAQP